MNPDPACLAASRMLAAVDQWRARPPHTFVIELGGAKGRINPGPHFAPPDLDTVASLGPNAASHADELRTWGRSEREAAQCVPTAALGFLRCLSVHGEAEALKRWPLPVPAHVAVSPAVSVLPTAAAPEHRTPLQQEVDKIMLTGFKFQPRRDDAKALPTREQLAPAISALLKKGTPSTVRKALGRWNWSASKLADELNRDGSPCGRKVWNIIGKRGTKGNEGERTNKDT